MAGQLLSVFGITFEADASDVEKGSEQAGKATDELEDKLKDTDKAAEDLGSSFVDLVGSAQGAIASLLSLTALTVGVVSTAALTDEVGKFSQTLGLNIEQVGAWSEAVVRSGGDANGFRSSIEGLTRGLTDFAVTGAGTAAETLARLGISATDAGGRVKTAFDILPELADSFEGLTAAEAAGFGERLGLDQGTILLLQQGRRAVEDLVERQRQLGVATEEDYEIAARFNDQWSDTKQVFTSLFVTSGSTILPLLTTLLQGVEKFVFFLADHQALVSGFFIGIAAVITGVYGPAIGAAAISTIAAIAPFIAIGAAIAAAGAVIALVVDDIYNFVEGNDSLIGQISEKYPAIGELIERIGNTVSWVVGIVKDFSTAVVEAFAGEGAGALDLVAKGVDLLLTLLNAMVGLVLGVGDSLIQVFTAPQEALDNLISTVKEFAGQLADLVPNVDDAIDGVKDLFDFGDDDEETTEIVQEVKKEVKQLDDATQELSGVDPDVPPSDFLPEQADIMVEQAQVEIDQPDVEEVFNPLQQIEIQQAADSGDSLPTVMDEQQAMDMEAFEESQAKLASNLQSAEMNYQAAASNPLNGQTSTSLNTINQTRSVNNSVSVGAVNVQTQATDAQGMASAANGALTEQLQSAVSNLDDGVVL